MHNRAAQHSALLLNAGSGIDLTDAEYYNRFSDSLADATGNHSPTGNAAYSYVTGLYGAGKAIDSNINGLITTADSDNLSFTDGLTDLPFTISFAIRLDTLGANQWILTKQLLSGGFLREYDVYVLASNKIAVYLRNSTANNIWIRAIATNAIPINTVKHYSITNTGTESELGLDIYEDGLLDTTAAKTQNGTYTGMANTSAAMTQLSLNGGNGLRGRIDCFGIWRRQWNADEAAEAYSIVSTGNEII